jgi:hypothetical protein
MLPTPQPPQTTKIRRKGSAHSKSQKLNQTCQQIEAQDIKTD